MGRFTARCACLLLGLALSLMGCTQRPVVASSCTALPETARPYPDPATLEALSCSWQHHGLLIIGERHGTEQIPRVVGDLIAREAAYGPVTLALERDTTEATALAAYLDTATSATDAAHALLALPDWRDNPGDGRSSIAMFQLLQRVRGLRARGRPVQVLLLRKPIAQGLSEGARMDALEAGMAAQLRQQRMRHPRTRVIALLGAFHARRQVAAFPHSVTDRLDDLQPRLVWMSGRGQAWNCQADACGPRPFDEGGPASAGRPDTLMIQAADADTLLLAPLTASAPRAFQVR